MMLVPTEPKIYHIVHVDRLASIVADGYLWSDAEVQERKVEGTTIGMNSIKQRRLTNQLSSQKGLRVGDCVPFYFCPRSVMLYVISKGNHTELEYKGGQSPIVHLEADMFATVEWAKSSGKRWAFTSSNAGSYVFHDSNDLTQLSKIDWAAVCARYWVECQFEKQAEFLIEHSFPWKLVSRIGVHSALIRDKVSAIVQASNHRPPVQVMRGWYY